MTRARNYMQPNLYSNNKELKHMVNLEDELVILAGMIDWDAVEEAYNAQFASNLGHPRFSGRFAFATSFIKVKFGYSDEELASAMAHNSAYQYFAGFEFFDPAENTCSSSSFANFRKRLTPEMINMINEKNHLDGKGNYLDDVLTPEQKELFLSYFAGRKKSDKDNSKKAKPTDTVSENADDAQNTSSQEKDNIQPTLFDNESLEEDKSDSSDKIEDPDETDSDDHSENGGNDVESTSSQQDHPAEESNTDTAGSEEPAAVNVSNQINQNVSEKMQNIIDKCSLANLLLVPGIFNAPRKGELILDATCIEAYIKFPTDLRLIAESVEWSDKIITKLYEQFGNPTGAKSKPRTNIRKSQSKFKNFSRDPKNVTSPKMSDNIALQLGYLYHNLSIIDKYQSKFPDEWKKCLNNTYLNRLETIRKVYQQQKEMFDKGIHVCEDRIVSLQQDWLRPIKRGKAEHKTEFGLKLHMAVIDDKVYAGYTSFNNFNEGSLEHLIIEILNYFNRTGYLPENIYGDKLYGNNYNRALAEELGIFLLAQRKGRKPSKSDALDKKIKLGERIRVKIEGRFGNLKLKDGLGDLRERLEETFISDVMMGMFIRNCRTDYLNAIA